MNQAITTTIGLAVLGLASASAGTAYVPSYAPPPPTAPLNVPTLCSCFDYHTASVSLFAAGILPEQSNGDFDDALGGGIALDYFFTDIIGIEVDATWASEDETLGLYTGSLIFRWPIKEICLAPYIFGGGGIYDSDGTQGVWHAGAGVDWRFHNCFGIFADARYTWTEDTDEYAVVRAGVRFGF